MSIRLTIAVADIDSVINIYDYVEIQRADDESMISPTMLMDLGVVNGNGPLITLLANITEYAALDSTGTSDNWYQSRYITSTTYSGGDVDYSGPGASGWSPAVRGSGADIFYDPCYQREISMTYSEQLVVEEIRRLIGDPVDLNREYGDEAASSMHPDGMTYELDEKGWPACITMGGQQYTTTAEVTVNGYRYLIFEDCVDITEVVCSGSCNNERGVDIWYYTFRHSNRQILEAYDNSPPPPPLNSANATTQAYVLYTAKRLLQQENWHDAIEDGATITDDSTKYDPSPGFDFRKKLLDDLNKELDKTINSLVLAGIEGVRVE